MTTTDDPAGDSFTITLDADQEMMFDTVSIVQQVRDDLQAQLELTLQQWGTSTREAIEQALPDWLASIDSGSVDAILGSLGLPSVVATAVKDVLAAGGDLFATLATFGVDIVTVVSGLVLGAFDYITGIKDLLGGPTKVTHHLHLAATIAYGTGFPQGWTLSVSGETSKFPQLTVSSASGSSPPAVVYRKNDVHAQGLLGLLLPYDAIPQVTAYP